MERCDMYNFNLMRLLEGCPFLKDEELKEGLADFIEDCGYDLNCINIDDLVINCSFIDKEEYEEYKDNLTLIAETDEGVWVL